MFFKLFKKKNSKGYFFGSPLFSKKITFKILVSASHEHAVASQHKNRRILAKSEIIRFADTGKFKVGDGVSFIEDLEFSDTLPEEFVMYVNEKERL